MYIDRYGYRIDVCAPARLETLGEPTEASGVYIENVSREGARVISQRAWRPKAVVVLAEMSGQIRSEAEVVYCQLLNGELCAIGLKFNATLPDIAEA